MKELEIYPYMDRRERQTYVADAPIDFATWLELSEKLDTELVRGVMIHRIAAQYPHEWTFMWLSTILNNFVSAQALGRVLGSRMAVRISAIDGRLPDLLFVRAENLGIIKKDAIYGTPDLVIEIVSENDRPSDFIPLEADYRSIGVGEIVFIDPRKKRVRYLRSVGAEYEETFLTTGQLTLACVPGFAIAVEWLFADEKPNPYHVSQQLIEAWAAGQQAGITRVIALD